MANIKKIIIVSALVTVFAYAGYGAVKAQKTLNAADKLDYDFDAFTLKEIKKNPLGIPTSLIYTITLKINNPTDQDLIFSKPYFKLSVKKADGSLAKIFNTNTPDPTEINIKSKSSTILKHDIELRALNIAPVLPNFFQYIAAKAKGVKGTQTIVADVTLDSLGLTIPMQTIIKL